MKQFIKNLLWNTMQTTWKDEACEVRIKTRLEHAPEILKTWS